LKDLPAHQRPVFITDGSWNPEGKRAIPEGKATNVKACFHVACNWCEISSDSSNARKHFGMHVDSNKTARRFHWCCVHLDESDPDLPRLEVREAAACAER
jgi:hypothetical protein